VVSVLRLFSSRGTQRHRWQEEKSSRQDEKVALGVLERLGTWDLGDTQHTVYCRLPTANCSCPGGANEQWSEPCCGF
jgi:hypothetical protein